MKQTVAKIVLAYTAFAAISNGSVEAAPGDLYDGGLNDHAIYKFDPAGTRTVFKSGKTADWLAFDSKGNLFASNSVDNVINKITPAGIETNFDTGITPAGLAFDDAGNLFAIAPAATSIFKYTPSGTKTTFASSVTGSPTGLAVDRNGNVFVSLSGNSKAGGGSIIKFTPTGTRTTFASGLFLPQGLAFDRLGNLYQADLGTGSIFRFTPTGTRTTFASNLTAPRALAFDTNEVLYASEFGSHDIVKFPGGVKTPFAQSTFVGGLAFEPPTAQVINISTRASVQTGDGVTIAGFIVTGTDPKQVVIRGLGPTLAQFGISNPLPDPTLDLHNLTSSIVTNDDWQTASNSNQIPANLRPPDPRESAILITLAPGNYTAIMAGKNGATGIGLVEVYDIATGAFAELTNVSTRGFVGTGEGVLIGGFITSGGNGSTQVVVRALGPTLTQFGVNGALADPMVRLMDGNGNTVRTNNNWQDTQQTAIQATGLAPPNNLESAIVATLPAGNYTAIVEGNGGGTGIALVEIYKLR